MSIDVPLDAVSTAGTEMRSAVEQAKPLDVKTVLGTVSGALPGAASAPAATRWGQRWNDDLASWVTGSTTYADLLQGCVNSYVAADEAATRQMQRLLQQLADGT